MKMIEGNIQFAGKADVFDFKNQLFSDSNCLLNAQIACPDSFEGNVRRISLKKPLNKMDWGYELIDNRDIVTDQDLSRFLDREFIDGIIKFKEQEGQFLVLSPVSIDEDSFLLSESKLISCDKLYIENIDRNNSLEYFFHYKTSNIYVFYNDYYFDGNIEITERYFLMLLRPKAYQKGGEGMAIEKLQYLLDAFKNMEILSQINGNVCFCKSELEKKAGE